MNDLNDRQLQDALAALGRSIPPPMRTTDHRDAFLRRAESVTSGAEARPLHQDMSLVSAVRKPERNKRMSKRLILSWPPH
ncbi:MAG: hypothetical protein IPK19_12225 [Chloroflexi bacterium]|nr:hypothetical protein [Chloroflexota bacterium]